MSLNKWCGIGRMVKDPNLRQTQSGKSVVSFTIAVDRDFKNKDGERESDFINIIAWGSSADFVARYFGKGDMIAVEGRLKIRNWTDENGANRKTAEIEADRLHFCGGKSNRDEPEHVDHDTGRGDDDFREIPDDEDMPF